jgi:hypothetical protein
MYFPRTVMHFIQVALFVFAASFLSAMLYVVVLQLTIPPSDSAYGQSLRETFDDPFVRSIATTGAAVFALVVLPFALFCLRDNWLRNGLISAGVVLVFIAIVTPFSPFFGAFGSPVVAILILLLLRFWLPESQAA